MTTSPNPSPMEMRLFELGRIHSPFKPAAGTPIQPYGAAGAPGYIGLRPEFVAGQKGLADFDRLWLTYWFHWGAVAKMNVIPDCDKVAHGLFATRAPARPNTIGMPCAQLFNNEGTILRLADVDILDIPPLDIKPKVPQDDNYPVEHSRWLDRMLDIHLVGDDRFESKEF